MKNRVIILGVGILLVIISGVAWFSPSSSIPLLFESDEVLELTLAVDMVALHNDRSSEAAYHEARISGWVQHTTLDIPVRVKSRGNFRRDTNHCEFPPLRIKFDKNDDQKGIFEGQKKLKLVTHCSEDPYTLKEFMVYRTYNTLTQKSFRVRLAKIKYVDTQGIHEAETRFAFFIESEKSMAKRNNAKVIDEKRIHSDEIQRDSLTLLYVFQYLAGNRDWDIYLKKNMKVIQDKTDDAYYAIPYDFDWTGTVEAPYTQSAEYATMSFSLRKFRNLCRTPEEFEAIFLHFRNKKEEIYHIYNTFSHLSRKDGSKCLKYYDQFYKIIDNPKLIKREFLDTCKDN